jgi:hypothetical protein
MGTLTRIRKPETSPNAAQDRHDTRVGSPGHAQLRHGTARFGHPITVAW